VRHLRILALCLAAMFAVSATTLVVASPALANCNEECQLHKKEEKERKEKENKEAKERKAKERAEKKKKALEEKVKRQEEELAKLKHEEEEVANRKAREKQLEEQLNQTRFEKEQVEYELYSEPARLKEAEEKVEAFEPGIPNTHFRNCPIRGTSPSPKLESQLCFYGASGPGSEFSAGKVTINFTKPIVIQGGYVETPQETLETIGPSDGAPTLVPVAQPGPPLKSVVDEEKLTEHERDLLHEDEAKSEETFVTIELAGPPNSLKVNTTDLIFEEGVAIALPVKVKLTSASGFLGEECYVGSNENPIPIYLTTATSGHLKGTAGRLEIREAGNWVKLEGASLVENEFASPGVSICGAPNHPKEDATVDEGLDEGLGLPSLTPESNSTIITGVLEETTTEEMLNIYEQDHFPHK
jgi:hypothetical protein